MAQTDPEPVAAIEPQAIQIMSRASEFLAAQSQFSVDWFVSFDVIIDGREKITQLRSGHNVMARDQGFYSFVEHGGETREYFYDGTAIQIRDVEENSYVMAPFANGFEALTLRLAQEYDIRLPLWQLMGTDAGTTLLDGVTEGAYLGITRLAGREAHHLAFSEYERDWQVWIADEPDRPELLMMVGTDPYTQGWPQFRVYFTRWDFDPEIDEGRFTYAPDDTAERMIWPKTGSVAVDSPVQPERGGAGQ